MGEHRYDGADVRAFPGVNEAVDDLAQPLVAECLQGGLLALLGKAFIDRLPGALQGTVHRGDRRVERLRHLLGRKTEHFALGSENRVSRPLFEVHAYFSRSVTGMKKLREPPARPHAEIGHPDHVPPRIE